MCLLTSWMEEFGVHPFAAAALLTAYLFPNLVYRDVADHLAQFERLIEALEIAFAATDAACLPGVMGMRQGPGRTSRPLLWLFRHTLK